MTKIVDTHVHLWRYSKKEFPWVTEEMQTLARDRLFDDLLVSKQEKLVEQIVLIQARQTRNETQFLCEIAQKHQEVLGVVGWTNLFSENREDELAQYQQNSELKKLVGFRHFIQDEKYPGFMTQFDFIGEMKLLKKYGYMYEVLIKRFQFEQFVKSLGMIKEEDSPAFVLDHMGKPQVGGTKEEFIAWEENIKKVAAYPQVMCKVSGLLTEVSPEYVGKIDFKPYIEVVVNAFGPDRLMLGSDWPVCTLEGSYEDAMSLGKYLEHELSPDDWEKITYKTAQKVYGKL